MTPFTQNTIKLIQSIPAGKVASYGQIAVLAGNHRGARQVSRVLHSCSKKFDLPWHRVVNSQGKISLSNDALILQKKLLQDEGINFGLNNKIDLTVYLFKFD